MLPAIFPAYVTGAVTAAGGSWNASIVSEVVQWGDTTLRATGIGAYIAVYTAEGDAARIALGIGVLCLYVLALQPAAVAPAVRPRGRAAAARLIPVAKLSTDAPVPLFPASGSGQNPAPFRACRRASSSCAVDGNLPTDCLADYVRRAGNRV